MANPPTIAAPKPSEKQSTPKGRKDRSVNYPAHTVGEAVAKAEAIWRAEKKFPVSPQLAAQHMGFKSATSGSAAPLMSSLRKYGIIESLPNGDVRISDDASVLFIYPVTTPEYAGALKRLAMKPRLFREVLQRFPDGLPSDANLRSRLQHEWKFASPEAADAFIRTLRAAMEVAGVDGPPAGEENIGKTPNPEGRVMPPTQPITATVTKPPSPQPGGAPPVRPAIRQERHAWKLGNDVWAEITITGNLGKKALGKLQAYVALLEAEENKGDPPVLE